jgi:23S rRNA pseudouridine1911/1915/1917 synthase
VSPDLDILWRSNRAVAINKPAQFATIPGRAEKDSVLEQLGRELGVPSSGSDDPRIRVVHRLDKDTTGVLLFALDRGAQQHFSHQFQNNTIQKEYLALVIGRPQTDEGVVDAPLAPHPTAPRRMAVVKHGGRPARTDWRIEQRFRGFTLLRCFPRTGKTHQIRVHLAHIGIPLAIDPVYSSADPIFLSQFKRNYRPNRGQEERPLISRLTLHAQKLRFVDIDGSKVDIEAPIPKDMRALFNQLSRHARP